jgi:hypothetical protein
MRNIGTFQVYALVDNMFRTEHYKSAHIANKQALNSIYICLKKIRDQYFKSDWNKKLLRKNRKLRTVNTHPIKRQRKHKSFNMWLHESFLCSEYAVTIFFQGNLRTGKGF